MKQSAVLRFVDGNTPVVEDEEFLVVSQTVLFTGGGNRCAHTHKGKKKDDGKSPSP